MNKKIIQIISITFLSLFSLILFITPTKAANTSLVNCSITQIPEGQNATQACFHQAKQVTHPTNCDANLMNLPFNETCCCAQKTEYSCTWRYKKETLNNTTLKTTVIGGCEKNETIGSDCNPATKPSSGMSAEVRYLCCCPAQATVEPTKKADFIIPQLSIKIDTVKLSQDIHCTGADGSGECHIPWIAEYIDGVYKYGFGVGGILAAIILMTGGLIWLTSAGDASKITQAKDLILISIIGLMILSTSYMILTMINPNLVNLKPLKIGQIEGVEVDGDSSTPTLMDVDEIADFLGINCGGEDSVSQIVNKSKGKVTYSQSLRGQKSNDQKMYFDCSSYAKFVRECAGLPEVPDFTGHIFQERIEFSEEDLDNLKPGDLLGWPPDNGHGHVVIYLGDGLFGDAHGGTGRQSGQAIGNTITFRDIQNAAKRNNASGIYIKR